MKEKIETLVKHYWAKTLTADALEFEYNRALKNKNLDETTFLDSVIENQDADSVGYLISIGKLVKNDQPFIDFMHRAILAPWHQSHEAIAHFLQAKEKPESVASLKQAMQKKFEYLESYGTGTRQFINQVGHALWSIGTDDAIAVIYELAESDDPLIRDEMLYRVSRIEGRDDYDRNYDLDD